MKKVLIVGFLFVSTITVLAQSGIIKGNIQTVENKSISNALVWVKELGLKTFSDNEGEFLFTDIPYGKYNILVSHLGYKIFVEEVLVKSKIINLKITLMKTPITLGEAVIQSSRIFTTEKNFSMPVESATEKDFITKVPQTIADVLDTKAGIGVAHDGVWGTMINVRGLSKQNLVYIVDGARIETSTNIAGGLSLFDLSDIEKVEVIKGGLSSLYGTGATGGVVSIITKQASFSDKKYITGDLLYGLNSVNKGNISAVNIFAGSEVWRCKLSASKRNAQNYKTPNGEMRNSGFKDYGYSASIGHLLSNKIEVNVQFQKYRASDVGIPGGAPFPKSATATYTLAERELINTNIVYHNPMRLINTLSLRYYNQLIRRDVFLVPGPGKSISPNSDHTTNGIVLKIESVLGKHFLSGGIDAWQRTYNGIRITKNDVAKVVIVDKPIPDSKFSNLGFFANDDFFITNKFKTNLGLRYDFIRIENDKTINPLYKIVNGNRIIPPSNKGASFDRQKINNASWSGNVSFIYKYTSSINFTMSVAKMFRSPSLEERYQYINLGGIIYLGNPKLKPERSSSLDLGFRYYGETLSFSTDLYLNYFNDLVVNSEVQKDSLFIKKNIGKSRFTGFDASLQSKLGNIFVNVTLTYVYTLDLETNQPLPQIPPLNGTLSITLPVIHLLDLKLQGHFFADQNRVATGENRTPGYALYDCMLNLNPIEVGFIKLSFFAGVENIFNKSYKNHLSTYRGYSPLEPGRNFYLKLSVKW
jgi:hemoglobin/transferrin/lactoferrin receptor protein